MAQVQPIFDDPEPSHDELTCSGYDVELFLDTTRASEFLCVICQMVVKKPRTHFRSSSSGICKAIFCSDCLKSYVRHHGNSIFSEIDEDAPCPFRCGVKLITKGTRERNIGVLPKNLWRKLSSLRMLCPSGRGTVRYVDYQAHKDMVPCTCAGFSNAERKKVEKRVDSMLTKICDRRCDFDEIQMTRNFAQLMLECLYPD